MGLRYRRSKKLGPFRINLSGSGVGWSVGGKYFRYTQPAKGKAYTTTTLPGTGISSRNTVQSVPQTKAQSPAAADKPKRGGCVLPVLIGLILGALILYGLSFAGSLSGYTRENMIPPPPERTASASAEPETEAAFVYIPEPPETSVTLSAPEAAEVTAPAETAPNTDAPAEIVPLEPDEPAETTIEEWFELVKSRTRSHIEEQEEDETTLEEWFAEVEAEAADRVQWYTVNTSTKKIHCEWCDEIKKIKAENLDYTNTHGTLMTDGYTWCQKCHGTP